MLVEYISLLVVVVFLSIFLLKFFKHLIKFHIPNLFLATFVINIALLLISQVAYLTELLGYQQIHQVQKALITSMFSFVLLFTSYINIEVLDKKKLQVLWKIPIIGLLAGFFFEYKYIVLIAVGYWMGSLIALQLSSKNHRFFMKKLGWLLPAVASLIYFEPVLFHGLNITLILIIIGSSPILDLVLINSHFKKADS